jgi:hypothetical protein
LIVVGATLSCVAGPATSTDLITWTNRSGDLMFDISYGNGVFVGIDDSGIITSSDGINWTRQSFIFFGRNIMGFIIKI